MKLIHIYIYSYKHLRNINVPLHGGFRCECNNNELILKRSTTIENYYDGLSIQGIIGKNGVGKSSILELISNNELDLSKKYILIWHKEGNGYEIQTRYYELHKIIADDNHLLTQKSGMPLNVSIANINNISPPFSYPRSTKSSSLYFTPSNFKTLQANQRQQAMSLSRFFLSSRTFEKNLRPKYFIAFSKLNIDDIEAVIRVIQSDYQTYEFFEQELRRNGFLKFNQMIKSFAHRRDSIKLNLYLSVCLQYISNIDYVRELSTSYQHCASFLLFLFMIKDSSASSAFSRWSNQYHHVFKDKAEIQKLTYKGDPNFIHKVRKDMKTGPYNKMEIRSKFIRAIDLFDDLFYLAKNEEYTEDVSSIKFYIDNIEAAQEKISLLEREPYKIGGLIDYGWDGLSSGELAKTFLLANIFGYISKSQDIDCNIILIDEIDLYLHPEWQRTIVNEIIALIRSEISTHRVQIIITSHSPIIISDLLPENIVNISRTHHGEITITQSPGYATQINDLYLSGMHISSTFGERVHSTLTRIMNKNGNLSDEDKLILSRIQSNNIRQLLGSK